LQKTQKAQAQSWNWQKKMPTDFNVHTEFNFCIFIRQMKINQYIFLMCALAMDAKI